MHDSLGQELAALHLGLRAAQVREGYPADLVAAIQQRRDLALAIEAALDRLTVALYPPALDDLGLVHALHLLVTEWSALSQSPVDLHTSRLEESRPAVAVETAVYRIAQEALSNIRKHAQATCVSLIVEGHGGAVRAIIEDNGVGCDRAAVTQAGGAPSALGLQSMEERVAVLGGRLEIVTAPGTGTTIYVQLPLVEARDAGAPPSAAAAAEQAET